MTLVGYPAGVIGPAGPVGPGLTPTAKSAGYTAVSGDFVQMTGAFTVTLPAPNAGRLVGVMAMTARGGAPVTISTPSGAIVGPGIVAAATTMLLGMPGASVVLEADGTNWNVIGGGQDTGWIPLPFAANFHDYSAVSFQVCQYRKVADWVRLRGLLGKTGAPVAGETIATLPAGFRPTNAEIFMAMGDYSGGQVGLRFDVQANGVINWSAGSGVNWTGSYLSLALIRFSIVD